MRRRKFLQLASGAAITWPLSASGQQGASLPLVAVITRSEEWLVIRHAARIREGLAQAGLTEGKDYALTLHFAKGDDARYLKIIKELDGLKPRVYVAVGSVVLLRQQLPNAPVVFTGLNADPIQMGWAESYARPGRMITGQVMTAVGGWGSNLTKLLGYFKEIVPNLRDLG